MALPCRTESDCIPKKVPPFDGLSCSRVLSRSLVGLLIGVLALTVRILLLLAGLLAAALLLLAGLLARVLVLLARVLVLIASFGISVVERNAGSTGQAGVGCEGTSVPPAIIAWQWLCRDCGSRNRAPKTSSVQAL